MMGGDLPRGGPLADRYQRLGLLEDCTVDLDGADGSSCDVDSDSGFCAGTPEQLTAPLETCRAVVGVCSGVASVCSGADCFEVTLPGDACRGDIEPSSGGCQVFVDDARDCGIRDAAGQPCEGSVTLVITAAETTPVPPVAPTPAAPPTLTGAPPLPSFPVDLTGVAEPPPPDRVEPAGPPGIFGARSKFGLWRNAVSEIRGLLLLAPSGSIPVGEPCGSCNGSGLSGHGHAEDRMCAGCLCRECDGFGEPLLRNEARRLVTEGQAGAYGSFRDVARAVLRSPESTRSYRELFSEALIAEVGFPEMDAASKDICVVNMKFSAAQVSLGKGVSLPGPEPRKLWAPQSFQLDVEGVDCSTVRKVSGLEFRQCDAVSGFDLQQSPDAPSWPRTWQEWLEKGDARDGVMRSLSSQGAEVARVTFQGLRLVAIGESATLSADEAAFHYTEACADEDLAFLDTAAAFDPASALAAEDLVESLRRHVAASLPHFLGQTLSTPAVAQPAAAMGPAVSLAGHMKVVTGEVVLLDGRRFAVTGEGEFRLDVRTVSERPSVRYEAARDRVVPPLFYDGADSQAVDRPLRNAARLLSVDLAPLKNALLQRGWWHWNGSLSEAQVREQFEAVVATARIPDRDKARVNREFALAFQNFVSFKPTGGPPT